MPTLKPLHVSSGMAFDPQTGESFQLNASAKFIITLHQQELSVEVIAQRLSTEFNIPFEQAITDVLEFQVQLNVIGLTL